ncbi:unnamed protein product, partial [Porites lobata]
GSPPLIESVGEEVARGCVKTDGRVPSQQGAPTTRNLTYWEVTSKLCHSPILTLKLNEENTFRGQHKFSLYFYQTRLLYHADEPPNKGETLAVHGYHCLGDMALRMREVLARRWVGVFVPLTLSFEFTGDQIRVDPPSPLSQQLPYALFGTGD